MDKLQSQAVQLNHVRRGSGEPLLLIHGIGDSVRLWEPVIGLLARDFEVTAVDLPGFGRSRRLPGEVPTPAALARAVREFTGGERVHVAGNSLGGGVALELGKAGAARTVCAISPIGFARGWERTWLGVSLHATAWAAARIPRGSLSSALVRRLVTLQSSRRPLPAGNLAGTLDDLQHAPGWAATLPQTVNYDFEGRPDCPTTVLWGDRDFLLLPWQARRARAALPEASHVTLTGCGHRPTGDDPEQVAGAIAAATRWRPPRAPAAA